MGLYKYRFNVFEKIEFIKNILQPIVPDKNSFRIKGLVLQCRQFRIGRIKKLTADESKTLELLLKHNLNPRTAYKWLCLEDVPPQIKEKLLHNKISFADAASQSHKLKRMMGTRSGNDIMNDMREVIGRLKWKSQEDIRL